ncbi:hypothetical protein DFH28DRAFT_1096414 [Melampsora americana]|nr:hypothetical protein DFH28DRAFT_1096414 [Melampsora americana]
MTSPASAIINFVNQIPHNVNPYIKVAHHVQALIKLPHFPPWLTTIQCFTIFLYIIVFTQAAKLLHIHIQAKHLTLVSLNQLGLIQVEFPVVMAIIHILYAPLVIFDIVFLELLNSGKIEDMSGEIIVFGCKFLLLELGSGCFVWVCACQCVSHFYPSPSDFSNSVYRTHTRRLHPIVRWWANTFFLGVILSSALFVGYCCIRSSIEYSSARRIIHAVAGELYSRAGHFNPQTYRTLDLLSLLQPASAVIPHVHLMAHFTRVGIIYHFAILVLLTATYVPTLWISLNRIYVENNLESRLCAPLKGMQGESHDKLSRTVSMTRSQRRTLVWQAVTWFSGTFIAVFILIAQLSFKGDDYERDEKWIALTYVGLHLPFGLLGNIILFSLNGYAARKYSQSDVNLVSERSVWRKGEQLTTNVSQGFSPARVKMQQVLVLPEIHPPLVEIPLTTVSTSTYKTNPRMDRPSRDLLTISPDGTFHHGARPPQMVI